MAVWEAEPDAVATDGDLTIRRLRNDTADLSLLTRWRAEPHVHEWWDHDESPPTLEEVTITYGGRTHPSSPTTACLIELDGRPIGYLQFYRWDAFPDEVRDMDLRVDADAFGLDILIGEPDRVGLGLGPRALEMTCRYLFSQRGATSVALTTEVTNTQAQRAYEKARFRKVRQILDLDTRDGERVKSWLMARERGDGAT